MPFRPRCVDAQNRRQWRRRPVCFLIFHILPLFDRKIVCFFFYFSFLSWSSRNEIETLSSCLSSRRSNFVSFVSVSSAEVNWMANGSNLWNWLTRWKCHDTRDDEKMFLFFVLLLFGWNAKKVSLELEIISNDISKCVCRFVRRNTNTSISRCHFGMKFSVYESPKAFFISKSKARKTNELVLVRRLKIFLVEHSTLTNRIHLPLTHFIYDEWNSLWSKGKSKRLSMLSRTITFASVFVIYFRFIDEG